MKKQMKFLVQLLIFMTILLSGSQVLAVEFTNNLLKVDFSDQYKEWAKLSDEEKKGSIMPRMYDVPKINIKVTNPLKVARMLRSSTASKYSLKTSIPKNMIVKNQQQTGSCWNF